MQNKYQTERLTLEHLDLNDVDFITELVNTPEWLEFIGDRNIRTPENARAYIQKIMDNPTINYWVVKLKDKNTPIGIITFIKRDYLEHYDIGFAFFSKFTNQGYAYEATTAVLDDVKNNNSHTHILATTVKENINSIRLLEKLGLRYEFEIKQGNDSLLVYSVTVDKLYINQITNLFYSVFTNSKRQVPALEKIYDICLPEIIIIKKTNECEEIYNIDSFIEPRKTMLSNGTLTSFEEHQIFEETRVVGNMAQRFSKYKKKGYLNGSYFEAKGNKFFQYIKSNQVWKITSVIWEDENI